MKCGMHCANSIATCIINTSGVWSTHQLTNMSLQTPPVNFWLFYCFRPFWEATLFVFSRHLIPVRANLTLHTYKIDSPPVGIRVYDESTDAKTRSFYVNQSRFLQNSILNRKLMYFASNSRDIHVSSCEAANKLTVLKFDTRIYDMRFLRVKFKGKLLALNSRLRSGEYVFLFCKVKMSELR